MAAMLARSMICAKAAPFKGSTKAFTAKPVARVSNRASLSIRAEGLEGMSWYPGAEGPKYLDGSMAGDYGFDPLRLGGNPTLLPYFRDAELTNGRWAMMAVTGIMFTDAMGLPKFWEAGATVDTSALPPLIAAQVAVMSFLEGKRIAGWKETGESGVLNSFPFDPMGMDSPEMRIKEVKNARLAMVAFVGMCSEAAVTGMGPIEGLKAHIADPTGTNIYTSPVAGEVVAAIIALSVAPVIISTTKSIGDGSDEEFRPIPW
eukprot:CAMPEP_0118922216 /NCGR_PEP_ID=MMETSP1169-20130426/1210_1 /TAXON_ID=36882 /ORGANISM="Pyramimonas obovata, Strain CCMP722" /LENGTH=259 /DNA_ID=CAMNT_0006863047 /DNA_START=85 /DNA_END=864 /DNA_ORIENTATION=+